MAFRVPQVLHRVPGDIQFPGVEIGQVLFDLVKQFAAVGSRKHGGFDEVDPAGSARCHQGAK